METQSKLMNNTSENKGLFFGFILSISQLNIVYGLPVVLFFILLFSETKALKNKNKRLFFLLIFQIIWMTAIFLFFPSNFNHYIKNINVFIIILLILISKFDLKFLIGLSKSLIILFIVDFIFNLFSFFLGFDPLGRQPQMRPDDVVERLGGIFGHSFFSLNISFIGLIASYISRKKVIFVCAIVNILLIGILRGYLILLLLVIAFYIVKKGVSYFKLKVISILFATSVFIGTFYTVSLQLSQANLMRVYAWLISILGISENLLVGKHDFMYDDKFDSVSFETIYYYGITESQYLELGLHYGLLSMIALLVIMFNLFSISYNSFKNSKVEDFKMNKITLISTFIIFTDLFFGSIFGSTLTTVFFVILIVTDKSSHNMKEA